LCCDKSSNRSFVAMADHVLVLVEKDRKKQITKNLEEARKPPKQEQKTDPNATAVCKFCGVHYKLVENKKKILYGPITAHRVLLRRGGDQG